ncbi:hypothetical protein MtrunA17_Chr1g0159031 [Medicago truncatula]|uniref:LCR-like protein n=1 Tax=Medicago truncatula TaxID=3880 RepID=A0A396JNI4_MEDTR|nr:hypothetical protein MtrunA17_Chr1g0159031 [Medicago truncatula]
MATRMTLLMFTFAIMCIASVQIAGAWFGSNCGIIKNCNPTDCLKYCNSRGYHAARCHPNGYNCCCYG